MPRFNVRRTRVLRVELEAVVTVEANDAGDALVLTSPTGDEGFVEVLREEIATHTDVRREGEA